MKTFILAALLLTAGAAPTTEPADSLDSHKLLDGKLALAESLGRFGVNSQPVRNIRAMIDVLESRGAKVDLADASNRFYEFVDQRREMCETLPSKNEQIVAIDRELAYLASLLAGDVH